MKSPFEKKFCGKSPLKELNAKQEANLPEALKSAIESSPNNYGSPLEQEKSPSNVGYYNPEFEAHPSEKLPTRQENKAELDAAKFGLSQGKQARKDMTKMKSGTEKTAKAKEAYDLSKPYFDAEAKTRKQKRKDYKTILKAGATIFKNM
jgi:bisphosphoglycerate-dependent phosphoglycerate mutase